MSTAEKAMMFVASLDPNGIAAEGERVLEETPRWRLVRRWRIRRAIRHFRTKETK